MKGQRDMANDRGLVARICAYLQEAHPQSPRLGDLSREFHISPYHLQRLFKAATGVSPREFAASLRLEDFKTRVQAGEGITDAIYSVGYSSSSRLYENSDEKLGMAPSTYRKRGQGMTIFYSVAPCPLGQLLVAVTERGICKLSLGDQSEELVADLAREFERAERLRDDEGVGYWVGKVIAYLEGWQPDLDLPLDLRATAFQLKVWKQLQAIPVGETRTYSEVAAAIGQPTASRAVANACAGNPVALVIPCHRIIRKDKSLGGYRWGIERKRALLKNEKRYAESGSGDQAAPAKHRL
ncbi:MAG: methylated-DNA--[protein]-cysteine S-methyltransferase [Chloroflexota bacterium]|nr:methylated-DNA--[protein]-cysteine S-methyltransferase [Chloroflexota bacterium]